MLSVGSLLPSILNELGIEDAVTLRRIRKNWREIIGAPICEHTYPRDLKEGELLIVVDSHAWLSELRLIRESILDRLKSYGVVNINFRYGNIRREKISSRVEPHNKISSEQREWIRQVLSRVKDEDMKNATERILIGYFSSINKITEGESK